MLTEERFQRILEMVKREGSTTVAELMEALGTSESTIRRDLNTLDAQGKLVKVHGGALAKKENYTTTDEQVELRKQMHMQEKLSIAKYAASLLEEHDFVYLDAGTTTEAMIDFIEVEKATFVTNAVSHAKKLAAKGCCVYLIGGEFKGTTEAIVGEEAIASVGKYNFTKGFFGANGITKEQGFTTPEIKEALIKQHAMKNSFQKYVLADVSKFEKVSAVSFGALEDAIVLTSGTMPAAYRALENCKEVS